MSAGSWSPELGARLTRAATAGPQELTALLLELEGADWALLLDGEAQLHAALAQLTEARTLRNAGRLPLDVNAARAAGFEAGAASADWRESVVWLSDLDDRSVKRARKADALLVADATFAPGGRRLEAGAALVAYRSAVTLSGHSDVPLAVLMGSGEMPALDVRAAGALPLAFVQRDLATLGVRLRAQEQAAQRVQEQLGADRVRRLGGGALLVDGDLPTLTLFSPHVAPGGVRSAQAPTEEGTLLTCGLEDPELLLADLRGERPLPPTAPGTHVQAPAPEAAAPLNEQPEQPAEEQPEAAPAPATEAEAPHEEPVPVEVEVQPDLPDIPGGADPAADLTDEQRAAYERLRDWRNAEARRQEVSRFIIASNATLAQIAREAPQTEAELRAVRGMGPERVRRYADRILPMVRGVTRS